VVVGEGSQREELGALSERLGVGGRIEWRGWVGDAMLKDLYSRCACVFYAPWDEDYGLVTLEAFQSGKPVVTTSDAGGPLEFVRHGETGLVAAPEPGEVAAALTRLIERPAEAREMGAAGRASIAGISWDAVITALVGSGT
jgi:glycosyltransferase involved in cell wall biosynthesis